ncbi:hypothetical protein BC938DRAFT_482218 [Jimgerdemannia flammicorona]|uniref:Uncharacterized protein n=1 Tax=Jimgerdemannia flammicorona TaxID=994334 RepID=A0A433QEK2_9FUNG|nr:hypothetical protein BC938DRAFT_482218 [Jimgerdemannia flammicorona]
MSFGTIREKSPKHPSSWKSSPITSRGAGNLDIKCPLVSYSSRTPAGLWSFVRVVTVSLERAHNELNASPRKPNDAISARSSKLLSLEV